MIDEITLLASVFESSLDAKLIIHSNGDIYRANRAAEIMFDAVGTDLSDKNLFKLVSGDSRLELKEFLKELKKSKELHKRVNVVVKQNLRVFDITANAFILDKLHLLILRDITERVMEREAREKFIAIAGHELKTPLAVIGAYTDLLKRRSKDNPAFLNYLNKIASKNKVLADYIDSITDQIKMGNGMLSYDNKEHEFDLLINTILEELKKTYPNNIIILKGKTKSRVNVDKERISQVVRNLVVNAIKHSTKNKPIMISIKNQKEFVQFQIKNQGKSIPVKEQTNIFKAFYRGGGAKKGDSPGLGLGLYIAKQIIETYKGEIGVVSKIGKDTMFYFSIPIESLNAD